METPVSARRADRIEEGETEGKCEQAFAAAMDMGELFLISQEHSVDTGATANLVCPRWLAHHNQLLEKYGLQQESTHPLW